MDGRQVRYDLLVAVMLNLLVDRGPVVSDVPDDEFLLLLHDDRDDAATEYTVLALLLNRTTNFILQPFECLEEGCLGVRVEQWVPDERRKE